MILVADPELMERAVFAAVRSRDDLARRYHREFSACYKAAAEEPEAAFRALHELWFRDLGFRDRIAKLMREFPHLLRDVGRLVLRQAGSRGTQGSELFGRPGNYHVIVNVQVATLLDPGLFGYWARHEFLHIEDMLDPTFGHQASMRPDGPTAAARNLVRDRYAVLWAISIDARLSSRMTVPGEVVHRRQVEFGSALSSSCAQAAEEFRTIWKEFTSRRPPHAELLQRAQTRSGVDQSGASQAAAQPGSPCPLCGFSTFDWAAFECGEGLAAAIRGDFPRWSPADGVCGRCAELYRSRMPVAHA